ncbi:MAG: YncE family protein [Dermatophilaceae bacterium]
MVTIDAERQWSPGRRLSVPVGVGALVVVALVLIALLVRYRSTQQDAIALPLRQVAAIPLPGTGSRFDYADLDPVAHRLWLAHLGDSALVEVDTAARRVVRTVPDMANVTGVIVVPALQRVFASTPGTGQVVTLDEETGAVLARTPAGSYPDGLTYVSTTGQVWVSDESGGAESVLDATGGARVATVPVGGEAGNVRYDAAHDRVLVAVQSRNELVSINPRTHAIQARVHLAGCNHAHGLILDQTRAFVACDGNDTLVVLGLPGLTRLGSLQVGHEPDVLALDPRRQLLYVASESGVVTTITTAPPAGRVTGRDLLGDNAHVVTVDPTSGEAYLPLRTGPRGTPELVIEAPTDLAARS